MCTAFASPSSMPENGCVGKYCRVRGNGTERGISCFLQLRGNHTEHSLEHMAELEWPKRPLLPGVEAAEPESASQRPETRCPEPSQHLSLTSGNPETSTGAASGPPTQPSTHSLIAGYREPPTSNSLLIVTYSVLKMTSPVS